MSPGEGAVTALAFFTPPAAAAPSHLLTGAADGSLTVWSAGGGWEAMKVLRGHRKEVAGIAVHPSGLLALSVARCARAAWAGAGRGGTRCRPRRPGVSVRSGALACRPAAFPGTLDPCCPC